ncbi:MAG: hypothetical protein WC969_10505 [Elusimicrobiota bacterium]|jgi:hypothetical protein
MADEKKVRLVEDMQCGACGAIVHRGENPPKYCASCGAGFDRYCIRCHKKVEMFFEEWWADDEECVRTYSPARRCPWCNAGLEVGERQESRDSNYDH